MTGQMNDGAPSDDSGILQMDIDRERTDMHDGGCETEQEVFRARHGLFPLDVVYIILVRSDLRAGEPSQLLGIRDMVDVIMRQKDRSHIAWLPMKDISDIVKDLLGMMRKSSVNQGQLMVDEKITVPVDSWNPVDTRQDFYSTTNN